MMLKNSYYKQTAESDLNKYIGSVDKTSNAFSDSLSAEYDSQDKFPEEACEILNDFGMSRYYVPPQFGGLLSSYEQLIDLWRTISRYDLTVAIGHGKTSLGGICTWLAGTPEQANSLGKSIIDGDIVSWGLTERHHGSDLMSNELVASKTPLGWSISGEKWLINNASRGDMICILARTDPLKEARAYSLFLIDKRKLSTNDYRLLPKELTYGIKGADISGIEFKNAEISFDSMIGDRGTGLEVVLKALQLTRTSCVGLSLGAADHAFELVLNFVNHHRMYDRYLIELPMVRRTLAEAYAKLMIAELVSVVCSRSIHTLTSEMSVISAVAKAFVPTIVDELISQLGDQLGSRAFLTEEYMHGMFQKLERDHRLIAIFDGSTVVNRNALINQFHLLARSYRNGTFDSEGVNQTMNVNTEIKALNMQKLQLVSNAGCSVVQGLPKAVEQLKSLIINNEISDTRILCLAEKLLEETDMLIDKLSACQLSSREVPQSQFDLAAQYELCFSGAACLQLWLHNRTQNSGRFSQSLWMEVCLMHLLKRINPEFKITASIYESFITAVISGKFDNRVN